MEYPALPEGFCDLATAVRSEKDTMLNVIGVVVDYLPPATTRTGEFMTTVKLLDPKLRDGLVEKAVFPVRFFAAKQELLPPIRGVGDVLLVLRVKSQPFNGWPMALSNRYETRWLLFVHDQIPDPAFILSVSGNKRVASIARPDQAQHEATLLEQKYVIDLKKTLSTEIDSLLASINTRKRELDAIADSSTGSRYVKKVKLSNLGPKFQLVKQLRTGTFADLCVMVVKKFYIDPGKRTELYVTDYTENDRMFYYTPPEEMSEHEREGDQFGYNDGCKRTWRGPFGHMVLKINTRHPHSTYANLWGEENRILILRNVKMKAMNDFSNLEGDMWPDDRNEGKNNVRRLQPNEKDWDEVHELLERKEKYDRFRRNIAKKYGYVPTDPESVGGEAQETKSSRKSSKAERKERKKEKLKKKGGEQKRQKTNDEQQSGASRDPAVVGVALSASLRDEIGSRTADPLWHVNQNIRANYPQVQTIRVLDLMDLANRHHLMKDERGRMTTIPFANIRARTLVRVVDFLPSLERFAVPRSKKLNGDDDDDYVPRENIAQDDEDNLRYEWKFKLQLEDASMDGSGKPVRGSDGKPVRFTVEVFHQEAQYLLGNNTPDPVDLTTNPKLLAQLREKMCILWGNLEEWKSSNWSLRGGLKNKPFVCCVAEYGVEAKAGDPKAVFGMRKRFKLTDTTIMLG